MKVFGGDYEKYFVDLENWLNDLPVCRLDGIAVNPEETAILVVDMTDGFCTRGALASPRMRHIVEPITSLMRSAWEKGVRNIVLVNDNHAGDAVEFGSYPPHCIVGTPEATPIQEIRSLPFYDQLVVVKKNSISSDLNTKLNKTLAKSGKLKNFIVVGDCTDICVYLMAITLRADVNARQIKDRRVIVPADCVETYDMPLEAAKKTGGVPHPADLLHAIFLQHMRLNGIEVVGKVRM
jgi:nicotinamidase-related amidase